MVEPAPSPNPYAPPNAPVADADDVHVAPCPHIELACKILWSSFALSMLDSVLRIFQAEETIARIAAVIGAIFGAAVSGALLYWITRKLRQGRNWMRWLFTILNLAGWLSMLVFWDFFSRVFQTMSGNWLAIISLNAQTLLGIAALVLLHTPTTRAWFRSQRPAS
jgi:hypothetical protein